MDRNIGTIGHQRRSVRVFVLLFLISGRGEARSQKEMQLKWSELDHVIHNKKVALLLPGGAQVKGKVLAVGREALRLRVSGTSDKKVLARGEREIPRASVSVLHLQHRTKRWRAILTPAIPIVLVGTLAVGAKSASPTPPPQVVIGIGMGVTLGGTVAGYYLGRFFDKWDLQITVLPD
jgi:hypothetical protein